jgi:prolyl-tRNA synthetase
MVDIMADDKKIVEDITSRDEDFSQWYIDTIKKAEIADYAPVRGCMVIRPYGYRIWELARDHLDKRIKDVGCDNAYFPLFIPESFLKKEAEHIEGFAPEVAWVTHGGDTELEERLAVRPTSEAIICYMFSKWIQSYRDLPLLVNQWANVVRWEKVTRPFLRTTEFLWQEGHTVHKSEKSAEDFALMILEMYREFFYEDLAIPVISGLKTEREKFPGAKNTYSVEGLMPDGRALQAGTSHDLGQHFARVFDIKFLDEDQQEKYAYQTSWGISTRIVGGLLMNHGDDNGLVLPPTVAPYQVVIVPIIFEKTKDTVLKASRVVYEELKKSDIRVHLDDRLEYKAGWKFSEWDIKGVPLRIEIGPRDVENNQLVLVKRHNYEKETIKREGFEGVVRSNLKSIMTDLLNKSIKYREKHTEYIDDYDEFKELMKGRPGFIISGWCGDTECEEEIQKETSATIRVIPLEDIKPAKKCLRCGKKAKYTVYFAKAY